MKWKEKEKKGIKSNLNRLNWTSLCRSAAVLLRRNCLHFSPSPPFLLLLEFSSAGKRNCLCCCSPFKGSEGCLLLLVAVVYYYYFLIIIKFKRKLFWDFQNLKRESESREFESYFFFIWIGAKEFSWTSSFCRIFAGKRRRRFGMLSIMWARGTSCEFLCLAYLVGPIVNGIWNLKIRGSEIVVSSRQGPNWKKKHWVSGCSHIIVEPESISFN